VIEVRGAAARFETVQPGIATWHCFSAGAHYDPDNTHFGALIAVDEHLLAPGAGFTRHAHRGVEIVSWVLDGALGHEDSAGRVELVEPGTALHQSAGSGIEHAERNASDVETLRFVQFSWLSEIATPGYGLDVPPVQVGGGEFAMLLPVDGVELVPAACLHLFVAHGRVDVGGYGLQAGDSARIRDEAVRVGGDGEVIVWRAGGAW